MIQIVAAGDSALLVRTGKVLSRSAYRRAVALWHALSDSPPPGALDLVLAYASVLVQFDPLVSDASAVAAAVLTAAIRPRKARASRGRLITIPVFYGGANGPDLCEVAERSGLTPEQVIEFHTGAYYRVYFLGFVAGFPYLGGLPAALAVPRLDVPRTHVPAGSVGIAGRQTGIYPAATPGGWRLIGRTTVSLFDPTRTPPALLRPGDRVRFVAESEPRNLDTPRAASEAPSGDPRQDASAGIPWLRVLEPGMLTTVQDVGRRGHASSGVAAGGAADRDALCLGNLLVGNPPGAAALEITLGAVAFEVMSPCVITVAGAECVVRIAGRRVGQHVALPVQAGERIEFDHWITGTRAYVCVAGGVEAPVVLGSRATDLRARIGGIDGRHLRAGDTLSRQTSSQPLADLAGPALPADPVRASMRDKVARLRILPGPHARIYPRDVAALLAQPFVVDPRSDRMGVRLAPAPIAADGADAMPGVGGEVLSEGVPDGAVQLPPGGRPILLLADHQTTGGYHVPAVVISADQWRAAQLRPGDVVWFTLTTPDEAIQAMRDRQRFYAEVAAQFATSADQRRQTSELLMRGFAEWGAEDVEEYDENG